jgi:hypothetical protein
MPDRVEAQADPASPAVEMLQGELRRAHEVAGTRSAPGRFGGTLPLGSQKESSVRVKRNHLEVAKHAEGSRLLVREVHTTVPTV